MAVRKPESNKPYKPLLRGVDAERRPLLWGHLTDTKWEDGSDRQTCTLFIFLDDNVLKGALNDRDNDLVIWGAGHGLDDLFDELEALLGCDVPPWKPKAQPRGKKGR